MSPDEQEAKSRKYSDDRIILLPLKSGAIAVFNNAAEFCGIVRSPDDSGAYAARDMPLWEFVRLWRRPAQREAKPRPTLEELGL